MRIIALVSQPRAVNTMLRDLGDHPKRPAHALLHSATVPEWADSLPSHSTKLAA
jgi:hypothetical protein